MLFQVGHFYMHEAGRQVAVLAEVTTYKWGAQLVIEEADRAGHSISIANRVAEANENNWIEIGREEWLKNFGGEQ